MEKKCSKCGIKKNVSFFYKASAKKDGFKSSCKDCCNAIRDYTSDDYKQKRKKWVNQENNKRVDKRKRDNLTKSYTGKLLRKQYGLTTEELNMIPELSDLKQIEIQSKRLCQKT